MLFSFFFYHSYSNFARINALTQLTNVSIVSSINRKFSFQFSKNPLFIRLPTTSFTKLTLKNINIDRSSGPLLAAVSSLSRENEISLEDSTMINFVNSDGERENAKFSSILIYCENSTLKLNNCVFEDCGFGRNCFFITNSSIELLKTSFINCFGYEGVLSIYSSQFTAKFCNFSFNYAEDIGGAIMSLYSIISFRKCVFLRNQCKLHGGAIYASYSDTSITSSSFVYNQAGQSSSACYFVNSNLTMFNSYVVNNFIANIGDLEDSMTDEEDECGVITIKECQKVRFSWTKFVDNHAGPFKDKAVIASGNSTIEFSKVTFDTEYNDSVTLLNNSKNISPTVIIKTIYKSDFIPSRLRRIIEENANHVKKIIIEVGSNDSLGYILIVVAISTVTMISVILTLYKISGGF